MWHEARKHERKLRGMMVDYKKRAERRREYYEKIVSKRPLIWGGAPREIRGEWGPGHPGKIWARKNASPRAQLPQNTQLFLPRNRCKAPWHSVSGCCVVRCGLGAEPALAGRRMVFVTLRAAQLGGWRLRNVVCLAHRCIPRAHSSAILEVWLGILRECHQDSFSEL